MSKRSIGVVLAGSIVGTGLVITLALARPEPRAVKKAVPQAPAANAEVWDASRVHTIRPIPVRGKIQPRTPEQEQLFQNASTILNRFKPIPKDRVAFYAWMNREDSPLEFAGWGCFVQDVKPTVDGLAITLWANPFALRHGKPALVHGFHVEEYLWSEAGGLHYARGYGHPDYGAGTGYSY